MGDEPAITADAQPVDQPVEVPWGPWATLGLTLVIAVIFVFVQILTLFLLIAIQQFTHQGLDSATAHDMALSLSKSGFYLSVATCMTSIVCTALTIFFVRLRKIVSVRKYLGLKPARSPEWIRWLVILSVVEVLGIAVGIWFDRPEVPDFVRGAYETAGSLPLLWLALVVAAPIFEEVLFRGFLFEGLRHSMLGMTGTVLFTSLAWTGIHFQYDIFDLSFVFTLGLVLGAARAKTGSVHLTIGLHAAVNTIALLNASLHAQ